MACHDGGELKPEAVADAVTDMKLEHNNSTEDVDLDKIPSATPSTKQSNGFTSTSRRNSQDESKSESPSRHTSPSPVEDADEAKKKVGGDITLKIEPGQPPKLTRKSSQKIVPRTPQLFDDLPDSTDEATSTFELMDSCTYANKYMGATEHAMDCDCPEEWDSIESKNMACGEDSDCINRATKMECVGDCGCGDKCQNQRFQRRDYANVAVIKTEKKGYGLRADADLKPNQFIFEYIGEVIGEAQFRRRMIQYDEDGIKHFYFMSLSKGEFVDATRKGNLGRFCNHSCNPNCYVDKWVVGQKLRMGIFAKDHIKAGEELVFNYNVDRYGADPQPCYCAEPNCTGYIGGKTQTERATKLSNATIEALGIDDPDGWDTAVARKPRRKKAGEDDEEYVDSLQPKSLEEDGVTKVMAALMQCKEKWIAVKLLGRIQRCDDERVRNRVVRMHGYQILNSQLNTWKEDFNVVLQILDILEKFPRLTRNKIIDSKIETTIKPLTECGDERVEKRATALLEVWAALEVGYRIPRMKRDLSALDNTPRATHFERRETREDRPRRSKSRSRSKSPADVTRNAPRGPSALSRAPKGPRNHHPHGLPRFRRPYNPLPKGWFSAESNGRTYYYSGRGDTTWTRPTAPAPEPPPPPKSEPKDKALQDIIDGIMNAKETTPRAKERSDTPATPRDDKRQDKKERSEKWRSYPEEKQRRIYENTLFPHIKYVVDKFKHKLPKDDLKRYGKELSKKLVNSDYKNNRVQDPTKISDKQIKRVKQFAKVYFDKAVVKHRAHEEKKAERKAKEGRVKESTSNEETPKEPASVADTPKEEDDDIKMSDDEAEKLDVKDPSPDDEVNGTTLKRKRSSDDGANGGEATHSPSKRQRSTSPYPPPPPPPPAESPSDLTPGLIENIKRTRGGYDEDEGYGDSAASPDRTQRPESPPPPPPPPPPGDNNSPANGESILRDDTVDTKDTILNHRDVSPLEGCDKGMISQEPQQASRNHATDSPDPSAS